MTVRILIGDCRERLRDLPDGSVDAVVCDPPYHLTSVAKRWHQADATSETYMRDHVSVSPYSRASKGFMGQEWDGGDVAFNPATWAEVLRVLKPGGHLIAFSGTRTVHRMVCAIEDAGFEIRDQLAWVYGSGFPKSTDVSKQIDKAAGAEREVVGSVKHRDIRNGNGRGLGEGIQAAQRAGPVQYLDHPITAPATDDARQWQGWGTALKPSWEPICLARKSISEKNIAANVLTHGTGALNIDGCRIGFAGDADEAESKGKNRHADFGSGPRDNAVFGADHRDRGANGNYDPVGRWPANLCHDGSDEVLAGFPSEAGGGFGVRGAGRKILGANGSLDRETGQTVGFGDSGSAARFFYCAKADGDDRGSKCLICAEVSARAGDECHCSECGECGQHARRPAERCACVDDKGKTRHAAKRLAHPTVKPVALMQWLVRLVTPKGGTVLDPFMGSGSTGLAAQAEQVAFIGCELSPDFAAIAEARLRAEAGLFAQVEVSAPPRPPSEEAAA